jgi:hypothetical protein
MKLAAKMRIPFTKHQLEATAFESSVGFEITKKWGNSLELSEFEEATLNPIPEKGI